MVEIRDVVIDRTKKLAIYGSYKARPDAVRKLQTRNDGVKQYYWTKKWVKILKTRKDGVKQYYWKKVPRIIKQSKRYEFSGKGKELYRATVLAHHYVPKGFIDVTAKEFIEHPEEYGYEGEWIIDTIKS